MCKFWYLAPWRWYCCQWCLLSFLTLLWESGQAVVWNLQASTSVNYNNHLMAFVEDNFGKPTPELPETLTQYTTFVVLKFLANIPNLLFKASNCTSGRSNTGENPEGIAERNVKNPRTRTYTLYSPNSGFGEAFNRWSPLTHASHCMTTSWPAAATQMTARVSPAVQPKLFSHCMHFLAKPSLFLRSEMSSEYAGLHILTPEARIILKLPE